MKKNGHNSRDTHFTIFSYQYSESASKNTPFCKFWVNSIKVQIFNIFLHEFLTKISKKLKLNGIHPKFAGRCIFWRWFRIPDSKNCLMCVTWVMAVFLNFSCRHDFWIVAHTLEVELLQNFLSFFGGSKGQLSRWYSENFLRDAKISKIGHFKIFSHHHFQKMMIFD